MARRAQTPAILLALVLAACSGASRASDEDVAKSDYHYRLARNYYADRNMAMTQRELYEALRLNPGNAEAHHLKGFVAMGMDDLGTAVAEYNEALRLRPDLLEARNNLGSAYIAQGRYAEAVQALKPLTEDPLYPTPAFAHGNIGWAYYQLGDTTSARRHLEMAVFLNPRFCLGFNNLGMLQRDLGNPRSARDAFEKAIKVCPQYAEPHYHLGVLLQQAGDGAGAEAEFAKCVELAGDSPVGKRCAARR